MTFPSGGPGYPQQGGAQPHQPAPGSGGFPPQAPPPARTASPLNPLNLGLLLALAVSVLGIVQYFIGFADEATPAGDVTRFLLVGGMLAGLRALPKGPKALPFAALFSVLGALEALDLIISVPAGGTVPGIVTVIMILGFLQGLAAVAALLFDYGVVKLPAPKPAAPQNPYGQQFGPYGQQPPQYSPQGQGGPQQPSAGPSSEPSSPFAQPTQFQPPSAPTPQSTTYAPTQGQFFQQPPADPGKPPGTGTPPGGFGQPS